MKDASKCFLRATGYLAAGLTAIAATPTSSVATPLTTDQLTELMIEEAGTDASALGLLFGPSGSIGFSSIVDTAGMSFSFTSIPGASYLGQPLSLSDSGTYNSATDILTVYSTGTLGVTTFGAAGSYSLTFSAGTMTGIEDVDVFDPTVKAYDIHGHPIAWNPDGTSTSLAYFTDKNGNPIKDPNGNIKYVLDKDRRVSTTGVWAYESGGLGFGVTISGDSPLDGGPGLLTVDVVPEPSTFALLGFGVLGSGAIRRRTR